MAKFTVKSMMGDYPNTTALRRGKITSETVAFDFADVEVPHDAFKRVVAGEFDFAELAIMTYMQARGYGRDLVALPVVLRAKYQHGQICYNSEKGALKPSDLEGRSVGTRTYPQTTPTWVRSILTEDHGVDISKIKWVTFGPGHVPEYGDPSYTKRAETGKKALQMLLEGELDAAIMGADARYPQIKPVIPTPGAAATAWRIKYNALQVNHIVVVKESLTQSHPEVVAEIYRLLEESRRRMEKPLLADGVDACPIGIASNERNFELAAGAAWKQRLMPRELKMDDLFNEVTRNLGA